MCYEYEHWYQFDLAAAERLRRSKESREKPAEKSTPSKADEPETRVKEEESVPA